MLGRGEPFLWKNNAGTGTNGESLQEQTEPGNQEVSGYQSWWSQEPRLAQWVQTRIDGWMPAVPHHQAHPGISCRRTAQFMVGAHTGSSMLPHTCPMHGIASLAGTSHCQVTGAGKSHRPWALLGDWGKPQLGVSC